MTRLSLSELRAAAQVESCDVAALMGALADDPRAGAQALLRTLQRREARRDAERAHGESMLQFERAAEALGFQRIAGVDEAGRGPLAGPVVAAAVILAEPIIGINDSKQLTYEQREAFFEILTQGAHTVGIGIVSPADIDRYGIQQSNYQAMARAIEDLSPGADYLLIDGFKVPGLAPPQERLIKGDRRSQSIAAASVVAKVTRDRLMQEYSETYPVYGFAAHKGYGTRAHLEAIAAHGPCPIHRMSFAPLSHRPDSGTLF